VIVDSGVRGSVPQILNAVRQAGYRPSDVQLLAMTHAHVDHIGSLPELQQATGAPIAASAGEAAAIEGRAPLPHPPGLLGLVFQTLTSSMRPASTPVQQILEPNAAIAALPGWYSIGTPGHTPDHISFYHRDRQFLIVGDAIANLGGLRRSPRVFTSNMRQAKATVALLAGLPLRSIAFGHGAPIIDDSSLQQQLVALARRERS
jgi:glyoxylase-like metal-dependent hydrolase (beta-lactamase superfamily II)